MRKKAIVIFFVLLLSVILVGSVYAGPGISGRFSVGSLHVEGTVTELQHRADSGVNVRVDASLNGVALCQDGSGHSATGAAVNHVSAANSTFIPPANIQGGRRTEFQLDVGDSAINALIDGHAVCPAGTTLVKLQIQTFSATLTAADGHGGFLASTSYDCAVNGGPNRHGLTPADCHITNQTSS